MIYGLVVFGFSVTEPHTAVVGPIVSIPTDDLQTPDPPVST